MAGCSPGGRLCDCASPPDAASYSDQPAFGRSSTADAVGSAASAPAAAPVGAPSAMTRTSKRIGYSLLIGPAGAGRAQNFDRLGRPEGHGDLAKLGDAVPAGQRLERAADTGRNGRRAAAQEQLPDTGQETLQLAVRRSPRLGEPNLDMACP